MSEMFERLRKRKDSFESKSLKVNLWKTKVMVWDVYK